MKPPDPENLTIEALMLWIMHRFADEFKGHVILKGGMQLMLLSSDRATNDLDYVFVPYKSKNEIVPQIDKILAEILVAKIDKSFHSNSGRYIVSIGRISVQIEFNVAQEMASTTITTTLLAAKVGSLPRVIRVMSNDVALAHKLAAWNERRLIRDLYDTYYWYAIVGALPNTAVLENRLQNINSRIPALKRQKKMSTLVFVSQLEQSIINLNEEDFFEQLSPIMPNEKLIGLLPVIRAKLRELVEILRVNSSGQGGI